MDSNHYNLLVNLVQAGLQKITDEASVALQAIKPQDEPQVPETSEDLNTDK